MRGNLKSQHLAIPGSSRLVFAVFCLVTGGCAAANVEQPPPPPPADPGTSSGGAMGAASSSSGTAVPGSPAGSGLASSSGGHNPSSTSGNASSTSTSMDAVADWAAYGLAVAHAACAYGERCADHQGRAFSSAQACEASQPLFAVLAASPTWTQHYTIENPAACLAGWETLACEGGGFNLACTWTARAGLAEGALCNAPVGLEGCAPGLMCLPVEGCNRCARPRASGEACGPGCEPGLYCDASGLCRPPATLGSPCTGPCQGNLLCTESGDGRTCQERRSEGQACTYNCLLDLECVGAWTAMTCERPLEDGAVCTRARTSKCKGRCYFSTPEALNGTCGALGPDPGPAMACSYVFNTALCDGASRAVETFNNQGEAIGCECVARLEDGSACTTGFECLSYTCTNQVCAPQRALGASCLYGLECQTLTCENEVCVHKGLGAFCVQDVECRTGNCLGYRCAGAATCQ